MKQLHRDKQLWIATLNSNLSHLIPISIFWTTLLFCTRPNSGRCDMRKKFAGNFFREHSYTWVVNSHRKEEIAGRSKGNNPTCPSGACPHSVICHSHIVHKRQKPGYWTLEPMFLNTLHDCLFPITKLFHNNNLFIQCL